MSCLHLHLCQWCQPDALGTEALCSGVGCRSGFAIEGPGQPGAGGEGGCDRVFCPTGSCVVGPGVQRQGLDSSYLPWEPQLPPCPPRCPRPSAALPLSLAGETAFRCGAGRDARPRHTGEQQKL